MKSMSLRLCLVVVVLFAGVAQAAGPIYWDWPADRAFAELELQGAALNGQGQLVAGLAGSPEGPTGPEVFWQAIADGDGGYYTGTGHGGEVHHTNAKGVSRLVATLANTEVFSLLLLPAGDLLVGGGPEGELQSISAAGEVASLGTVAEGYIWAMTWDAGREVVWLAAGSPAALYRYDPARRALTLELELPAQNALDVALQPDGHLLVAAQGPGLIYRYDGQSALQVLHETAQDEARRFVTGPDGETFLLALQTGEDNLAGLAGRGNGPGAQPVPPPALMPLLNGGDKDSTPPAALYRITAQGAQTWWTGNRSILTATWHPRWGWLAGGSLAEGADQAQLLQLTPPSGAHVLASWAGGDVLDILSPGAKDDLVVCQAHPGSVQGLSAAGSLDRLAVSPPLDGGAPVRWGRLTWQGVPGEGKPRWSVRGGNRAQPDDSWSAWQPAWTGQDKALDLEPCRYLQWRVALPTAGADAEPWRITEVAVSAWQPNQAPVIADFQLEHLQDINLGGMLNGGENVTQRFRSGLQAEFSRNVVPDKWAGPSRTTLGRTVRVFTWQGRDANGDRLVYRLEYRRLGDAWRPVATHRPGVHETGETLASWDTSEVPDGTYELRLIASDKRDNPAHLALEAERRLGPVHVDNTAPAIERFAVERTTDGFTVRCRVEDQNTPLAAARIILPDGTIERLDPVDLICDSLSERFTANVVWPRSGRPAGSQPWLVRVEVRDLAGNLATAEGSAP